MTRRSASTPGSDIFSGPRFSALYARLREQPRIASVPRMPLARNARRFQRLATDGYPVILTLHPGAIPDRAALLQLLREQLGDHPVVVRTGAYDQPHRYGFHREYQTMRIRDYLLHLEKPRDASPGYAGNHKIDAGLARRLGAPPPRLEQAAHPDEPSLWLGGPGAVTPLHKDARDNFAIHLFGAKRWTLFPVRDAPLLGLRRPGPTDMAFSLLDLGTPERMSHLERSGAVPLVAVLQAGEMLYVPEGWAHHVETLEPALMVNYWIGDLPGL